MTDQRVGLFFALPAIILLVGILGFPAVAAILQSFDVLWGSGDVPGIANYVQLAMDPQFWQAFRNTTLFVASTVSIHITLGLCVALLLNADVKGKWLFRVTAILPWTVPDVISGILWRFMFDPLAGFVNALLTTVGLIAAPIDWLGDPQLAFAAVVFAEGWRGYPFIMLILLAGLQSIGQQQYEAAQLDGASTWQCFLHVTIPNLKPMLLVAAVLDLIWQARLFGLVFGMTSGGPGNATEVMPLLIYRNYFEFFNASYAASMAVVLAAVMLVFAVPYVRSSLRKEA
ncbi:MULTISPECIES: sugar ABC transporter permease [unclassified Chelatococcus]|uniref:carbohydrate ABC transporter permease n=1 Tax=unclassified Chelatococcus TaxID=2638111 RepID=UPI001BCC2C37|nr:MULTISPECIES: sugar ABC transporter permease [unclassified Chelatococcus]MBS7699601.1 sugar ABC transporter permease [Chelatococcus sp. YT9]MBX3557199.1 sugar ABC transporter permease [Chelatococcus sp.]